MRKLPITTFSLLLVIAASLSCGYTSPGGSGQTSGLKYRAFISDNVSAGTSAAGIYIVDAQNDIHPTLAPIAAGNTPGMMVVTPNRNQTLVFSGTGDQFSDNVFSLINNASESNAAHVTLPGFTESFVVSPDSSTAYVAVPTAPVVGQSPGNIKVLALNSFTFTGEIDIPSVRYLSMSNSGNRILAFSTDSDSVAVVTPSNLGTNQPVVTYVAGFDRPVQAYFSSDDSTAYIVNCGAECGGVQAGVQQLNMTTNTPGTPAGACTTDPTPQCAGSVALVIGSTMYLAGTPYISGNPSFTCTGQAGETLNCGMLTIFDLGTMSVVTTGIAITDGYHNRIAMAANGQLFIGARTCTEIIPTQPPPPGAEVRGCLSIYNSLTTAVGSIPPGGVVFPPANGDATGIQPIATRTVVYVIQGGSLGIYDTATDALQSLQIKNLIGNFIDVKTVDF